MSKDGVYIIKENPPHKPRAIDWGKQKRVSRKTRIHIYIEAAKSGMAELNYLTKDFDTHKDVLEVFTLLKKIEMRHK